MIDSTLFSSQPRVFLFFCLAVGQICCLFFGKAETFIIDGHINFVETTRRVTQFLMDSGTQLDGLSNLRKILDNLHLIY